MTSLALRELTISHFRSHKRARLSLDGRPVVLHGVNGAGKTNILEAVSMFSPGRGLRRATMDEMIRRPEQVGWKISGVLQSLGQMHEVETWVEPGQGRQVRIDGKVATQVTLGRITRVVWLVPVMDRLWVEGAEGRRRFLDRLTLSFTPSHADAVLNYEKAMRERNRLLKDGQRDPHWYRAIELQMAMSGTEIHANRLKAIALLQDAQASAETEFPAADLSLVQADEVLAPATEDELATALAESRPRDLAAGRTLVGPHRSDLGAIYTAKDVPARDCSTGEQKALLVSLILANGRALARDFGAAPIYLLDEVAAHLDAGRRAALYDEICALGAQAFMTGTGPELFAELGHRAAHFRVSDEGGTSTISEGAP
ncbi:DNA replication/repair protein RecF [Aliiroseovarius crassostreae]|uniref:DNA replication and repair protein RecF n=1 Tax=Aliiroseovarius crassostreae TaxID=154981 RepID=A0A9Q9H9L3_9RHOB|nr:DNA replication/repair protein RecF [Aliiroseovarius crassostreae]UWP95443.1 DNA replication/repair protein RecF [Aliiroseovarius crassostreae]UWP98603.1 DNA replication/repair protein RecF [Aliiroseovarius crassostreae]UWQ11135.1 DNA replication/repair protein RecF [Aliiroseovarius crassostreae]